MEVKLGVPAEEIPAKCAEMYSSHGTTMAGLVVCSMGPGRLTPLLHAKKDWEHILFRVPNRSA